MTQLSPGFELQGKSEKGKKGIKRQRKEKQREEENAGWRIQKREDRSKEYRGEEE